MTVAKRWVWARCYCARCKRDHTDLVPASEEEEREREAGAPHNVICDHCYARTHGSAAAQTYAALRRALGGEPSGT